MPRRSLAVALAVAVAAIAWVQVARVLEQPLRRPTSTAQPTAVVWGNRVFTDARSLRRWLVSRGGSYGAWAQAHPHARAIVEHRPYRPPGAAEPPARRVPQPVEAARPASGPKLPTESTSNLAVLIWISSMAIFVGLTVAAWLAPRARLGRRVLIRFGAAAAALALSAYFAWAILGYRAVA